MCSACARRLSFVSIAKQFVLTKQLIRVASSHASLTRRRPGLSRLPADLLRLPPPARAPPGVRRNRQHGAGEHPRPPRHDDTDHAERSRGAHGRDTGYDVDRRRLRDARRRSSRSPQTPAPAHGSRCAALRRELRARARARAADARPAGAERAESRAARPRAPRAGGARVASAQTRCTEVGMKWVLAFAGVIVVLVAAAVVLGMLLPRDHVVGRAARIAAPPD